MTDYFPPEVLVTELPDGVRYRLPLRRRGWFISMGLMHCIGGLVGVCFMTFWLYAVGYHVPWRAPFEAPEGGMLLVFMIFGGMMLCAALWSIAQGLSRLIGHSEIELRGDTLRGLECLGPLRWGWRRPVAGLARFDVRDATMEKDSVRTYQYPAAAEEYNVIAVLWETSPDNEKTDQMAWGYPRAWLLALAHDLVQRCRVAVAEPTARAVAPPAVAVTEEALPNPFGFVETIEQPPKSTVQVEESPETLKFTVPRHFPRRRTVLIVEGDALRVEQKKQTHTWTRQQLADVRVGRIIDHEGPDTPLLLIQPHPGEGQLFRLPMQDEAETRWLATKLRQALRLEDTHWEEAGGVFLERAEQPAGSPIVLEHFGENIILTVPPCGLGGPAAREYLLSVAIAFLASAGILGFLSWFPNFPLFQEIGFTFVWLVLAFFAVITFACLVMALQRGYERAVLQVLDDTLVVHTTTLYRTSEERWRRAGIADIRVGFHVPGRLAKISKIRADVIDQGKQPWELQIHRENGDVVGLLTGRPGAELQWLATVLRRALDLPKDEVG